MSICKRNDGRWCVKVKDLDHPGRWVQRTFRKQKEAKEFERSCGNGVSCLIDARLSVVETVDLYLGSKDLSDNVKHKYIWLVTGTTSEHKGVKQRVGYAQCIADRYVDTLTRRDLEMVRENARKAGASNATINNWTGMLCAAFDNAVEEDLLRENPWKRYKRLPVRHGSRKGSKEDFQKVYAELPEWMQWACRTGLALFARPGLVELFGLTWSAFNFSEGSVTLHMGKVDRWKTVYPRPEYMAEAKARFEAAGSNPDGLVCPNAKGKLAKSYSMEMAKARRKAGVAKFPMYALRHIAASEALAAGADLGTLAAAMGHSTPTTTLRYYAHSNPQALRGVSLKIGAIWCSHEEKSE